MRKEIKDILDKIDFEIGNAKSREEVNSILLHSIAGSLTIIAEKVNKKWR